MAFGCPTFIRFLNCVFWDVRFISLVIESEWFLLLSL